MTSAHKNTWFSYFALVIFEIFAAYAIFSGIEGIAGSKPYTRLYSAAAICVFAAVLILLQLITTLIIKVRSSPSFSRAINAGGRLESIAAACILAAGALARVWVISSMPIEPSSDYQTYYNVAELFSSGVCQARVMAAISRNFLMCSATHLSYLLSSDSLALHLPPGYISML